MFKNIWKLAWGDSVFCGLMTSRKHSDVMLTDNPQSFSKESKIIFVCWILPPIMLKFVSNQFMRNDANGMV